jgi:hypothetical protein
MAVRSGTSFAAIGKVAELADYTVAFAIRAVCRLGIADHLAGGERELQDLATASGTHPPSLLRVMRVLVAKEVFAEPRPGWFALTPAGDLLRTDHPLSMRWAFRLEPDVQAMAALAYSVRTGEPSFEAIFGAEYFSYLAERPELLAEFRESQSALSRLEQLGLLRAYDWTGVGSVVDVGGNDGTFLSALLRRYRGLRGVLFDLPDTVAAAAKVFADAGVEDRCQVVPGNLFTDPVPAGYDAYLIKRVLVGYDDEETVTLLRNIRAAMRPDSRLLIFEPTMRPDDDLSVTLDVRMLVLVRGRVRTAAEHGRNLEAAGLALSQVITAPRPSTIIEARPAGPEPPGPA